MRAPLSWLRDFVDLPDGLDAGELADRLTALGLKLETLESTGSDVSGPVVVGAVVDFEEETHSNAKTVRWCQVDVGEGAPRGVVCGARNFDRNDRVVVALPGAVLPGPFPIAARPTYGHVSDGMICSARELGLGDDHVGILVLDPDEGAPGDDALVVLHLRDDVLDLEVNPDRAYALSVRGVAREAAIACDREFHDPASALPAVEAGAGYPVRVEDRAACEVFVALEVAGFDSSARTPRWLARRVQLAGMRPISLAVDVTNYVMLELGTPIHGYDRDRLRGDIVVRRAEPGETLTTLDDVDRQLSPEDLLIADDRGPIGLAGVMGGAETELGGATSAIVIEAAHFDPVVVARAARRHKLPSEASKRFERGVDPTLSQTAALRVADLLVRFGGGSVAATATVVGAPAPREAITIDAQLPSRVGGFAIDEDTARQALTTVGCDVTAAEGRLTCIPPPWRHDLVDPNDLVEEVVRIGGYDRVPSVLPAAPAGRGLTRSQRLRRRAGVALAAAGFVETPCPPFVAEQDSTHLGLPADDPRRTTLRVHNPLSEELPLLRTTLLPGLLRALARNVSRGEADVALFEVGSVFLPGPGHRAGAPSLPVDRAPTVAELKELEAALPDQPLHLGVSLCGDRVPRSWWGPAQAGCWADAVQAVRTVAAALRVEVRLVAAQHMPWHPGRCGEVLVAESSVGYAGELHPRICRELGVPARTAVAEIDLSAVIAHALGSVRAPRLSSYPVGKADVALVVAADVPAAEVEAALRAGAGELLESARLFDVYVGEQAGPGRKSLAYGLRFRAPDRTLTDAEIGGARDAAVAEAAARVGAVQRS
ncbi:MAG: phenylalanine--tRNA ligase subunit beta [Nocardioidaceae bacterium]